MNYGPLILWSSMQPLKRMKINEWTRKSKICKIKKVTQNNISNILFMINQLLYVCRHMQIHIQKISAKKQIKLLNAG